MGLKIHRLCHRTLCTCIDSLGLISSFFFLPGEHIAGQTAGHQSAERREAKESGRSGPRLQTSDVSVAIFPLSSSHPPPLAASFPLSCHRNCVFLFTLGQSLTPNFCFRRIEQIVSQKLCHCYHKTKAKIRCCAQGSRLILDKGG